MWEDENIKDLEPEVVFTQFIMLFPYRHHSDLGRLTYNTKHFLLISHNSC